MASHAYSLGWRADLPDIRDRLYKPTAIKAPPAVDLRPGFEQFQVFDQGRLGSCVANSVSAAIAFGEMKASNQQRPAIVPARLGIYYYARQLEGTVMSDSGAEIRDGLKVVAKRGYVDESKWPYDIKTFTKEVDPIPLRSTERVLTYHRVRLVASQMMLCLAAGFPFVFGISVYSSFMDATDGVIPLPSPSETLEGGHALLCVGYDVNAKVFRFRNSWGEGWGDRGYGTIPFVYLTDPNLCGDLWTVRSETA